MESALTSQVSGALPNLDFIRAVAVLSVVIEHTLIAYGVYHVGYWETSWIGVVGVFIFFVHTCLVLMWSLERKPHTLDFYIRRIFRIYPLVFAAIIVVFLFHAPVSGTVTAYFHYARPDRWLHVITSFTLTQDLFGGAYPEGVMWSLPYEMQMYLVLPVLFFFVRKNFSVWPLLLLWLSVIAACLGPFPKVPHNIFLCIPYFLPGVMAYVGFGRWKPILPAWLLPPALVCVWLLFMAGPGWRVADLLCLSVGLGMPLFHQFRVRWLMRVSHLIAKYSYGIYLAHPFSIVLGLYLMPHKPLALQLAVIAGSLVAISVGAYHALEHPMIRLGARLARKAELRWEQHEAGVPLRRPETSEAFEPRPTD